MADVLRLPFLFCAFCLLSGIVLLFIEHHHKPGDSGKRANQCKRKIVDAVKQLPIDFFLCEAQKNSKQNQCNALQSLFVWSTLSQSAGCRNLMPRAIRFYLVHSQ